MQWFRGFAGEIDNVGYYLMDYIIACMKLLILEKGRTKNNSFENVLERPKYCRY